MTDALSEALRSVRLIQPWMGGACLAVVVLIAGALWWTRTRHLPWRRQVAAPLAGLTLSLVGWCAVDVVWRPVADGLGPVVWVWLGLTGAVVVQVLLGGSARADHDRVHDWKRRLVRAVGSGASIAATVAAALLAVNAFFAAFPSLAAVFGMGVATTPLAALPAAALSSTWSAPADMPSRGEVVTATIPAGDQSGTRGFRPRDALIYLPPAYLTEQRPALPVVVALTGQPGSPSDWYELGGLKDTMDAYAAAHDGLAPVVVVADLLGNPYRNPLCSDTVRGGRVATYLEHDVPAWIRENLGGGGALQRRDLRAAGGQPVPAGLPDLPGDECGGAPEPGVGGADGEGRLRRRPCGLRGQRPDLDHGVRAVRAVRGCGGRRVRRER